MHLDAEENLSGVEIEFEISGTDDQETEDTEENDDGEETETEEPRPAAANATPVYSTLHGPGVQISGGS